MKKILCFALFVLLLSAMEITKGFAQPTGSLNGVFTIAMYRQVCFSKGNLQYQASTDTWRFADHQWDYVGGINSEGYMYFDPYNGTVSGSTNNYVSPTYSGWIDLFGYGTSGWNSGVYAYQPWADTATLTNVEYLAEDLTGDYANADWGVYNAISNGGNQPGLWRTLSQEEWEFLINTRPGDRFARATVNGVCGVILLPDGWNSAYALNKINKPSASYDSNVISLSDWDNVLEANGAVFFPCGGVRGGHVISYVNSYGHYWTSTASQAFWFYYSSNGSPQNWTGTFSYLPCYGCSVRLVHDIEHSSSGGGTQNGHDYVDLGLPSGLMWATCNIGGDTPFDYGNYYAWGETQPKDIYSWSNYQYCNGDRSTINKYCVNSEYGYNGFTDGMTVLLSEDDAALANWGADWRMPTKAEFEELYNNTTNVWATQNGVNGRLFLASNGNCLFLPAGGVRSDGGVNDLGNYGDYWSSSLNTEYSNCGCSLNFRSGNNCGISDAYRCFGQLIRPVRSDNQSSAYSISATSNPIEGGTVSGGGSYNYGSTCTLTATPNTGYSFVRWTKNGSQVSTNPTYSFTVTANASYVAVFSLNSYTISVSANPSAGGTVSGGGTYNYGSSCTLTATPATGYTFVKWTKNGSQVTTNPTYSFTVTENASYVAVFSSNGYTISASANPSEGGTVSGGGSYNYGSSCTLTATPAAGYSFSNWTENGNVVSTNANYSFTVTGNRTLVANFTANPVYYSISVSASPSNGGTVSGGGTYNYGNSCTLTATPATGYSFVRWTKNGSQVSTNPTYSFAVTENASYVAVFSLNSYTISVSVNPSAGGTVSGGGTYNYDSSCTLTATPAAGYTFVKWTKNGSQVSTNPTYSFTVTEPASYVAVFNLNSYTISASADPSEGGTVSGGGSYSYGSNCTLTATPATGYAFNKWTQDGNQVSTSASYNFMVTENASYVAVFGMISYGISATAEPSEGGTVSGGGLYHYGSSCTLTATPATGYTFVKWTKNGSQVSTNPTYSFTVTEAVRYVAVFSLNSYTISVSANPSAGGTISGGGSYNYGSSCTLTATPNSGYIFSKWIENGTLVSTNASYSFTVTSNRNLVARFAVSGGGTHEYVDLGLPSGTLWATCNVGANTPEEYGDYFAWGETQPKDNYNWSNYQHCNGNGNTLTRYCNNSDFGYNGFTDNLTVLLPVDDAATVNWGAEWRMPTKEEFEELNNNTTFSWTTQNGVNGWLFTANNGNSLFLPATGSSYGYNDYGSYWSSTLDPPLDAYRFYLYDIDHYMYYGWRSTGYCVRPVHTVPRYYIEVSADPLEGGYVNGGGVYTKGSICTLIASSKVGYSFDKWTMNGIQVSTNTNFSFIVAENANCVAVFNLNSYTISSSANPSVGGIVNGAGTYNYGSYCTLTAAPNTGYTFLYWSENGTQVSTNASYSFTVTGNRNLVANFTFTGGGAHECVDLGLPSGTLWATCNVGADSPEGYGDYYAWGETQPKDYYDWSTYQYCNGSGSTLTQYCSKAEYGNNGFTDDLTILLPEDDISTLDWGEGWHIPSNAQFEELYENTEGTWVTRNGVNGWLFTADNGNSLFMPVAGCFLEDRLPYADTLGFYWSSSLYTTTPNYAFIFHIESNQSSNSYVCKRRIGCSIRPVFSDVSYAITATSDPSNGGTITGAGSYVYGQSCTLTATANSGYTFVNWTENGTVVSTNATYRFSVSNDRSLVANFVLPFTISAVANPIEGGSATGAGEYDYGTTCTLTATANTGYTFVNWTENGLPVSTDATYSFVVSDDRSLVANFVLPFTISAIANPAEGGVVTGAGEYDYGTTCTLTATANTGYTFVNWTENGVQVSTDATYSFDVSDDRSLVANFVLPFTISAIANPAEGGVVTGAGEYDYGTTCTLTATPNVGYFFLGWTENGQIVSCSSEYRFTVMEDRSLMATYTNDSHLVVFEGNTTNGYVPVFGFYTDYYLKSETVYPASEIREMAGDTIGGMRFFATQTNVDWGDANFQVFLKEVDDTSISAFSGIDGATIVYEGPLSINNGVMQIAFTTPYLYTGSNLLLGVYNTVKGSYQTCSWYGETVEGASVQGRSSSSLDEVTPTQRNFIPKTMFFYESGSVPTYSITATPNSDEAGSVEGAGAFLQGQTCSLTAIPNEGYSFYRWTENGVQVSTDATYSFSVADDRTLVANFYEGTILVVNDGITTNPFVPVYGYYTDNYLKSETVYPASEIREMAGDTISGMWFFATQTIVSWDNANFLVFLKEVNDTSISAFSGTDGATIVYEGPLSINDGVMQIAFTTPYLYTGNNLLLGIYNTVKGSYETSSWYGETREGASVQGNSSSSLDQVRPTQRNFIPQTMFIYKPGVVPTYYIATSSNPTIGGTITGTGTYEEGQTCMLTAMPNDGYTFTNWTENGEVVSTDATYSFMVTGERDLVANFSRNAFHFVTAGTWNTASNWSRGALPGANDEAIIDASCQLDMNATVAALTVSDGQSLTLQSGKTLTVTNTLINTVTTGLIIEDGAQLVHSSENVSATVKKSILGHGTNRGKYALISNPLATTVNPELASIYHLTRGNYDLYDWLPNTPDNLEWRNYKDSDFIMLPDGYGYLYANQNGVELNFPGTLKPSDNRFGKSVSYDSSNTEHPGWNLIGNPFACNAKLVNANNEPLPYYRMNAAGNAFELVAPGTPIAPVEGIFYKASGNEIIYFIRADFSSDPHEYVDLGLPSGLLWATCNVGAESPEDYGDYFAWGETESKDTYNWGTYQHCEGSDNTLTKYCSKFNNGYNGFTDNLITLLPEDDAATSNWGNGWRMPTNEELEELYNNTTVTWTIQNGVNGRLFTASNGNSLFLPAAGCRYYDILDNVGRHGYYWSSSLNTGSPYCTWFIYFDSVYYEMSNSGGRCSGLPVRAVREN